MDDIVIAELLHGMVPSCNGLHSNRLREILREAPGKTLHKGMVDVHRIDSVRNEKQYLQHGWKLLFMRREVKLVSELITQSVLEVSPDEREVVRIDEQCGDMLTEG